MISSSISLFHIYKHATTYTKPNEQRNIIRILLVVPIYSVTTMFSYVWYWHAVYWQFARLFPPSPTQHPIAPNCTHPG